MSLVRLLPAWLHAIADYAVAITLIAVAVAVGGSGKAVAAGVVIGAVVLVVSMLTRYPLGVFKVLPFTVHSAGDYLATALLIASPFALKFTSSDRGLTVVYLAAGVAVLGVSLITNYQYRPQRQLATAGVEDRGDAERWFAAAAEYRRPAPTITTAQSSGVGSWRSDQTVAASVAAPEAVARPLREVLAEQAAARWPAFPAAA